MYDPGRAMVDRYFPSSENRLSALCRRSVINSVGLEAVRRSTTMPWQQSNVSLLVSFAAPATDDFTRFIVLRHVVQAVAIHDVNIPIGRIDGGFGGFELRGKIVFAGFFRVVELHQFAPFQVGFNNLMAVRIGNQQILVAAFAPQRKAMRTGVFVAPGFEQLPRFIVNNDVVLRLVGQQT